jgi:flagellar biosynthesis/type III secretory pathway protein FliH/vacuolar-type H+-ATPase subunit H
LSERFVYDGYFRDEVPLKSSEFEETVFSPPASGTPTGHFKEFVPERKTGDPLKDLPSLGYLFDPFDPGKPQTSPFEAAQTLSEKIYAFKDLDLRDENIINTIEKAEKKASRLLEAANKKAMSLEEEARSKLTGLSEEMKAAAVTEAEELVTSAKTQAEQIVVQAKESIGNLDQMREELTRLKAEAAERLAELNEGKAKAAAAEKELAEMRKSLAEEKRKASEEAKKVYDEAKKQGLADGLTEGRARGETEGLSQGAAAGHKEVTVKAAGLIKVLEKINNLWPELWKANGAFMVQLAVEAVEAIVNKEIQDGRGLAAGAFKACLDYLQKAHEVVFKVCPADLQELEEARALLREQVDGLLNISFQPDSALGPGDLIMEADVGRLDATVKNRREKVMAVLRESLAQGSLADPPEAEAESPAQTAGPSEAQEDLAFQPASNLQDQVPPAPPVQSAT